MGKPRFLFFLILLLALADCSRQREMRGPVLRYEMQSLSRTSGICDSAGRPCVSIRFSYPAVARSASPSSIDSITAYIDDQMFASLEDAERVLPFDSIASGLIEQYSDLTEEFADYRSPWMVERSCSILADTAGLISIRFEETSYLGGAHGMQIVRLASFDASSGKQLTYDDLFRPGYEGDFALAAEKQFRVARSIPDTKSLADAGFWIEEGKFEPPQNFAVGSSGLILNYNPYEIAPYALGPTEVRIPFAVLKDIVRRDGPLAGIVR
jgi:hypothetical protein